jgi:hypothetical protein
MYEYITYSTDKNIELFNLVKQVILEEPLRANINSWRRTGSSITLNAPPCGTVGCIAGWADTLHQIQTQGYQPTNQVIRDMFGNESGICETTEVAPKAIKALRLTLWEAHVLFDPACWPYKWRVLINRTTPQTQEHAHVIVRAIDAFLADSAYFCREANTEYFERVHSFYMSEA